MLRPHRAALGHRDGTGVKSRDGRALVDGHASLERHAAQASSEEGGLHGRYVAHERAAAKGGRRASLPNLLARQRLHLVRRTGLGRRAHYLFAHELVARSGGGEDVAGATEPRIDAVLGAELLDAADASGDLTRGSHRALVAVQLDQAVELVPPPAREAAVAAARAAAADVLLEHRDAEVGIPFREPVGGPEPGEAAADDDDIGHGVARQRRARLRMLARERLTQPPTALSPQRQRHASQP